MVDLFLDFICYLYVAELELKNKLEFLFFHVKLSILLSEYVNIKKVKTPRKRYIVDSTSQVKS